MAHGVMVPYDGWRSFKLGMSNDRHLGLREIIGEKYVAFW
jgi:hypothetical protein